MALPIIAHTFRCSFIWADVAYARNAVNVMHFSKASADSADIAAAIDTNISVTMFGVQRNTSEIQSIVVTPLDGTSVSTEFLTGGGANYKGAIGGGDTIPQVANLIKLTTNQRGRSHQGRVYLPWVCESQVAFGSLISTDAADISTAWLDFVTGMADSGVSMVVASYKLASASPVTGARCEQQTVTQRKRQPR